MTRALPAALKAHYAQGTTTIAQCWRATLRDGTVIASTTHSQDLVINDVLYVSAVGYNPSNIESSSDLSYDNMEVDGYLSSPQISLEDVHSGRWDYAEIVLFEVNYKKLSDGINILRSGTLGQVKAGRAIFTAELRGLTQKYARRIVMLTTQECNADFGDSRCKINLADWTVYGSAGSVSAAGKVIADTTRTEAADHFTGGLLTWTTGLNVGLSMEVKAYSPGSIELHEAMPYTISTGDQYKVYAGCQKRFYQDCIGKFDNGLNFRGFPHLPGVGVFGGPGTVMTPATVPGSQLHSPPPPPLPAPPAPGPAPVPAPPSSLAGKVLGCYFTAWDFTYQITMVPLDFNVIYLFNARPSGSDGTFVWPSGFSVSPAQVQTCRGRGQKVILTVGGAGLAFAFTTRTQSTNFVNSVKGIISSFGGLDGVDFNTFEQNTSTSATELVWIAQQLKATYGADFAITAPPGATNTGGPPVNGISMNSPADLNLMGALADAGVLTYAAPQFYDWSFFNQPGVISSVTDQWVARLGASRVVVGLSANYSNGPSLADCIREYDAIKAKHPDIRGAFCWSAQTNLAGGNVWGSTMRSHVGSTTAAPPPPPPPPAPAPAPVAPGASSAVVPAPAGSLSLASYGAVADGTTNNLSAINTAIAAAKAQGKALYVPPGTWAWSGSVIHLDGVSLTGAGPTSILYALDYTNSSIWMEGNGPKVQNLRLTGAAAPGRQDQWQRTKIVVMGASNFVISNNVIQGAPAASIQMAMTNGSTGTSANNGTISSNTIQDSLSDSIHMTAGAHHITVENNLIERSGDDGIAVVSYSYDAAPCTFITARNNVVKNNVSGRNMSVVGGEDITYTNNYLEGNTNNTAGIYLAQEGGYGSRPVKRVKVELNTVKNCGGTSTGHAQIMVFSDGTYSGGVPNDDIWLLRNDLISSGTKASVNGIRYYGPQTNVKLDQNRYTGSGSASVSTGSGTTVTVNTAYSSGAIGYTQPT